MKNQLTKVPRNNCAHVRGDDDQPLSEQTVTEFFKRSVKRFASGEACVFVEDGIRLSYQQLDERVDRLAAGFLSIGLYKGDRIGIWAPNRVEWLISQLATARIGLILVNINPAYRTSELEYALNKVGARALITAQQFKSSDYIGMLRELMPELDSAKPGRLRAEKLPELRSIIHLSSATVAGAFSFDDVLSRAASGGLSRLDSISSSLDAHDIINIQFTSGTTGSPKGASLSHYNIINNAVFCAQAMAFGERDRLLIAVPLYHCFGMVLGNLACISTGATMVFATEGFDAGECLSAIEQEGCTAMHGVPTIFASLLDHAEFSSRRTRTLRTGIMAGAPCPRRLMQRVVDEMGATEVTIAYGMTETSPVSFQSDVDDDLDRRVSTVGRVHPHVEVKIVNDEGGTVAVDQTGQLLTRGYAVMKGYWADDDANAKAISADGWMRTGDLATIDAQGYCVIAGRLTDMVIRGGENIYPREVEEFLYTHSAIQSAHVFGIPDDQYGEQLCAWIVLHPGQSLDESALREFCKNKIAHYKIPVEIRFVDDFPVTVTGKPQKYRMREAMITSSASEVTPRDRV